MNRQEFGRLLNLRDVMIPAGRPNRSGSAITPTSITVHNTSNTGAGANAAAHAKFVTQTGYYMLNGNKNWVSWHYTVDDKEVIKHLPLNEKAIHAGSANGQSIAIEICMHQGIDQQAANLRAARLVAALLHDFGWGIQAVRTHRSWTGKKCPTLLLDNGKEGGTWDAFCQRILQERNSIGLPPALVAVADERTVRPEVVMAAAAAASTSVAPEGDIIHRAVRLSP